MILFRYALLVLSFAAVSARAADVDKTLDILHDAGAKVQSLAADVELTTTDMGTGNDSVDRGRIVMQRLPDGDTRARITFTEHVVNSRLRKVRRDFLLADGKLIEQNEDAKQKTQVTRQMRRPGEKIDLFKLGQGPFPLPIGQSKEAVHEQFDVAVGDADNVVTLSPRKGTPLYPKFRSVTVTVDPAIGMPTTIQTIDPNGGEKKTVVLKNLRLNDAVKDEEFILPPTDDKTWSLRDE